MEQLATARRILHYANPNDRKGGQIDRLNEHFQFIQTDYPWHVLHDEAPSGLGIPTDPSRRLRDWSWRQGPPSATSFYRENGARLYAHTTLPSEIWAYAVVPAFSERWWETTISTTRHGDTWTTEQAKDAFGNKTLVLNDVRLSCPRRAQENGEGGIRISSGDGADAVVIARQKNTQPGPSFYQEKISVYVRVFQQGKKLLDQEFPAARYGPCKSNEDQNFDDVSSICVGSLIALSVNNDGARAIVTVFSAGQIAPNGSPDWKQLGRWRFGQPLTKQGFSTFSDVLFAGPRMAITLDASDCPANQLN